MIEIKLTIRTENLTSLVDKINSKDFQQRLNEIVDENTKKQYWAFDIDKDSEIEMEFDI